MNGVWGSFIANNQGEIMFSLTPPDLKEPLLEDISSHILDLMVSTSEHLKELSEIVFHYAQKKLFIVDLEDAILAVVCTPSVDISLLRMSVNVVRTGWDDDPEVQELLKKNSLERQ